MVTGSRLSQVAQFSGHLRQG